MEVFSQQARKFFVGRPFSINYDQTDILTSDDWKNKASGLPKGCFLLAFYIGAGTDAAGAPQSSEALLLRALEPIKLPNNDVNVASMIEYYKEHHQGDSGDHNSINQKIDPYTRFEFSMSGLSCRVLGSFYKTEDGEVHFGADIENFFAPNNYEVYKPTEEVLEAIVNQRDKNISEDRSAFKIGTVRYSSTKKFQDDVSQNKKVVVHVSANDFLGKRTALFGMTRTGKSNTIKKIIEATAEISRQATKTLKGSADKIEQPLTPVGLPTFPVGQLIFDINGEYANENLQDEGTAVYKMYEQDVHRYSCIRKEGFKEMKVNFYKELQAGFDLIKSELADDTSDYVKSFMTIEFHSPDPQNFPATTNYKRLVTAYRCCLYQAGFKPPEGSQTVLFQGNAEVNGLVGFDPKDGIPFDKAVEWFTKAWEIDHDSLRYKEDLRAVLAFLTRRRTPGAQTLVNGYMKIRRDELRNYHTNKGEASSFRKQINTYLRDGKIVIVDLSEGHPIVQQNFSEQICQTVFQDSVSNFTTRRNNNFIQFYFEEAHNLFPQAQEKDLSQIYNRLAKEGAKLNIGLLYATQEVSSLSRNILKNTQNWFIAHLNNRDELKELQKYYDFADFTDSLLRFSANNDKGFVRMKTYSNPFVVPIQVDRFQVVKAAPKAKAEALPKKEPQSHGLFQQV